MRVSVVRMARAAASRASAVAVERPGGGADAGFDDLHGKDLADDAGGANEHLRRPTADGLGGHGGHPASVVESALAGAGVGIAGANDDAANIVGRKTLLTDADGSGADTVLCKCAGSSGGRIADNQSQVKALGIRTDAGVNAGEAIAAREMPVVHKKRTLAP